LVNPLKLALVEEREIVAAPWSPAGELPEQPADAPDSSGYRKAPGLRTAPAKLADAASVILASLPSQPSHRRSR
jgi:hypothetical protein